MGSSVERSPISRRSRRVRGSRNTKRDSFFRVTHFNEDSLIGDEGLHNACEREFPEKTVQVHVKRVNEPIAISFVSPRIDLISTATFFPLS